MSCLKKQESSHTNHYSHYDASHPVERPCAGVEIKLISLNQVQRVFLTTPLETWPDITFHDNCLCVLRVFKTCSRACFTDSKMCNGSCRKYCVCLVTTCNVYPTNMSSSMSWAQKCSNAGQEFVKISLVFTAQRSLHRCCPAFHMKTTPHKNDPDVITLLLLLLPLERKLRRLNRPVCLSVCDQVRRGELNRNLRAWQKFERKTRIVVHDTSSGRHFQNIRMKQVYTSTRSKLQFVFRLTLTPARRISIRSQRTAPKPEAPRSRNNNCFLFSLSHCSCLCPRSFLFSRAFGRCCSLVLLHHLAFVSLACGLLSLRLWHSALKHSEFGVTFAVQRRSPTPRRERSQFHSVLLTLLRCVHPNLSTPVAPHTIFGCW